MTRPERSPKQTSPTLSLRLQEDVFLKLESQRERTGSQKSDFYRDLLLRGADASGLKSVKTAQSADARALLHVLHRIHQDCERIADLAHQAVDVSACDEITRKLDLMLSRLNAGVAA